MGGEGGGNAADLSFKLHTKQEKRRIKKARKGKKKGGGERGRSTPPSSRGNHRRIWKGRSSKGTREKSAPYKAFFG